MRIHVLIPSLLSFLLISAIAQSQDITVNIRVVNQKKDPVGYSTVSVVNRLDSTQRFQQVADSNGKTSFRLSQQAQYLVNISAVNYAPFEKGIQVSINQKNFIFSLEPAGKTLDAVVVRSQKPVIRQEDDMTVVEPEALAAASTSGYEIIEKTPGLFVDQDGNIYIASLAPATVQINGRDLKMSAADVAALLKSLPPNSISKIEIIRTPSAKYDASGAGGLVNVVLKKGVKLGKTGSVNAGWQQGVYANEFAGFTLNTNEGKKSAFINLNVSRRNSFERIRTDRIFAPDSLLSQDAYTVYPGTNYFAGAGLTYSLGKKWEFEYSGSFSLNDYFNKAKNPTQIIKISTHQLISDLYNTSQNDGSSLNIRNSITFTKKMDSVGSVWTHDLFHNYTGNQSEQAYTTQYQGSSSILRGDGNSDGKRNYFSYNTDLKLKLPGKLTVETGLKTGWLFYKSRTEYFKELSGQRAKDAGRTNSFDYDEKIHALYGQASKTFGKDFVLKLGTRLEQTNMNGHQLIPGDTSFSLHRTDLFPYVYLSKNVMKIFGFDLRAYLIYRRTISRPVYEQLNPFARYVDQFLSETGNPSLRPQFTQNYEANISVDERPILAFGVNDTKDIFTSVIYQSDTSQSQAYRTYDNLGKNKEWYFRGLGAIPPGGKYFIVIGAQYNHNFYQGQYDNKPLSFKKGTWTFFSYQQLKLGKLSQLTINGFMRFRGQQGFYELSSFGALNSSINRQFFKQKLIVTLSANDIFKTNRNEFSISQGGITASGVRQYDTRRFGINIRYNFGIRKKDDGGNDFNAEPPN